MTIQKFLTQEEIASIAPAIYQETPKENVSKHYVHVPTATLIEDMAKMNWKPVQVSQQASRKVASDAPYKRHMVVFRNEEVVITDGADTVYPQIILTNSHDGLSAFTFRAGLYRLVCSNGLVIATKEFEKMSIRHKGYTFEALQETLMTFVEQLPKTVESLNSFRETILTDEQKVEMALKAIGIRFGVEGAVVEAQEVLKPARVEDEGNDLWTVFNVIQEKMIRGGFGYKAASGRNKTARTVKNFTRDIQLNQQLYALAHEYAAG